jgi:hypothetical protein
MNLTAEQRERAHADHQARAFGFVDRAEKERAETWLETHKGREQLLVGIAGLLRKLDALPRGK